MQTLQQTKDEIDRQAGLEKVKVEEDAIEARRLASEDEIEKIRLETEYKIQEIKNNAQT